MRFKESVVLIITGFLILILTSSCNDSSEFIPGEYYSRAVLKNERKAFLNRTIYQTILKNLSVPLQDSSESDYQEAFWGMELIQFRNSFTDSVISESFRNLNKRSSAFQRAFIEIIYSLYQNEFPVEIKNFADITNDPRLFAMCVNYLRGQGKDLSVIVGEYLKKHPEQTDNPLITILKWDIESKNSETPPLSDLLSHNYGKGKSVIFSFQRKNRDFTGITVIRDKEGGFVRNNNGSLFYIRHLARSVTNLPGYITNGNTPQGIFSVQSVDSSGNIFIGPTPNLQMVLPYEVKPFKYFHGEIPDSIWNLELYTSLLPASWKKHTPVFEAYYAGKAGRNEIIAHGTTIDPDFYSGRSYFPFTPSLGCITSREIWSSETGRLIQSDQIKLINALNRTGSVKGYFILVQINDSESNVNIEEIEPIITETENQL